MGSWPREECGAGPRGVRGNPAHGGGSGGGPRGPKNVGGVLRVGRPLTVLSPTPHWVVGSKWKRTGE